MQAHSLLAAGPLMAVRHARPCGLRGLIVLAGAIRGYSCAQVSLLDNLAQLVG